jgi:hypothetical protein
LHRPLQKAHAIDLPSTQSGNPLFASIPKSVRIPAANVGAEKLIDMARGYSLKVLIPRLCRVEIIYSGIYPLTKATANKANINKKLKLEG